MIILGVDPGLTRCGVGVIEAGAYRRLSFIHVDVVRSDPKTSQDLRLLAIYNGLVEKIERFAPDAVSIERVFAQENRNTVLGTAQAAGLAMLAAAQRGIPVALHTPTESKLAITGNGKAEKIQMERMVARILGLNTLPKPADAADALAIAICHALRPAGALQGGISRRRNDSGRRLRKKQRADKASAEACKLYRTDVLDLCEGDVHNDWHATWPCGVGRRRIGHYRGRGSRLRGQDAIRRLGFHARRPGNQGLHFVECVPGRHHFIRLRHAGLETHVPAIAEGQWHRTESRAIVAVHFASRSTCEGCGGW